MVHRRRIHYCSMNEGDLDPFLVFLALVSLQRDEMKTKTAQPKELEGAGGNGIYEELISLK